MLDINIKTIPDENQRYNTVGDYQKDGDTETVTVSEMNDWKKETLTAVHELIESALCKAHGISDESITDFDLQYEKQRQSGVEDEPGNDPSAPYHKEHVFATEVEKRLAQELGVNWDEYGKIVAELDRT
jgi:hypothetical protein